VSIGVIINAYSVDCTNDSSIGWMPIGAFCFHNNFEFCMRSVCKTMPKKISANVPASARMRSQRREFNRVLSSLCRSLPFTRHVHHGFAAVEC